VYKQYTTQNKDYQDIQGLTSMLIDLIDSNSTKRLQDTILKSMVSIFRADSGQFCLHGSDDSIAHRETTALCNLDWIYTNLYISHYHNLDPFLKVTPRTEACRNSDLMCWSAWQKLDFYDEFLKPQVIAHVLVTYLRDNNRILGHIGLHRQNPNSPFSPKDVLKAQTISMLFSQKLNQKLLLKKANDLEVLLKQQIEVSSDGIIVLDANLNPIFYNSKMNELILSIVDLEENPSGLDICHHMLPGKVIDECIQIRESLRNNKWKSRCDNRHIVLWTDQNKLIGVDIRVILISPEYGQNQSSLYFVLTFDDALQLDFLNNNAVSHHEKLTPKELEISKYICQGLTNKEISNRLFINISTVTTHIYHIFQKLNVKSRSKLIYEMRNHTANLNRLS
jgi:DNA-binding CsgD family transcriptional regulator